MLTRAISPTDISKSKINLQNVGNIAYCTDTESRKTQTTCQLVNVLFSQKNYPLIYIKVLNLNVNKTSISVNVGVSNIVVFVQRVFFPAVSVCVSAGVLKG